MIYRKRWLVIAGSLLTAVYILRILLDSQYSHSVRPWWSTGTERDEKDFVIVTAGCRIPRTDGPADGVDAMFQRLDPAILRKRCEGRTRQPLLTMLNDDNTVVVLQDVKKRHKFDVTASGGAFYCEATPIARDPDGEDGDEFHYEEDKKVSFTTTYNVTADNVRVECHHNGTSIYTDFHGAVQHKPAAERRFRDKFVGADKPYLPDDHFEPDADDDRLSVVVLTLDSVSRANFARQLPRTRALLLETLGGVEFAGYVKVGDNTLPNLLALLTGSTSEELLWECPLGYDGCPFVWRRFADAGYVTAFAEDAVILNSFNAGSSGFERQPTDYYLRPLYQAEYLSQSRPSWRTIDCHCFAGRPQFPVLLNWTERLLERLHDRPHFAYLHVTSVTHDDLNWAQWLDDPLHRILERASRAGWLRRTALLLISDHGMRFGGVRDTTGGRLEENLPLLTVTLPDWWRRRHRQGAFETLKTNAKRLTTPFDVHDTLLQLLDGKFGSGGGVGQAAEGRGTSLFRPISDERTCETTSIPGHFCPCQTATPFDPTSPEAVLSAAAVLDHVNAATVHQRHLCAELSVQGGIRRAHLLLTTTDAVLAKSSNVTELLVSIEAEPGDVLLEGTVRLVAGRLSSVLDVSRINKYGNQAACLSGKFPELRKFCVCKKPTSS